MKRYKGDFLDGKKHGNGSYVYANRYFHYDGDWLNGKKHGWGKFTIGDSVYEGEFQEGEITGQGRRMWADGSTYDGWFQDGEMHGLGIRVQSDGTRYEGQWRFNQRHGEGKLMFPDGSCYEGIFCDHKVCGKGVFSRADGSILAGTFKDGLLCGRGRAQNAQGDVYEGDSVDGKKVGNGIWQSAVSNSVYSGLWDVDKSVDAADRLMLQSSVGDTAAIKIVDGCAQVQVGQELSFQVACARLELPPDGVNVEEVMEQKAKRTTTPGKPGVEFTVKAPEMVMTARNNESGRRIALTIWKIRPDAKRSKSEGPVSTKERVRQLLALSTSADGTVTLPPGSEQAKFGEQRCIATPAARVRSATPTSRAKTPPGKKGAPKKEAAPPPPEPPPERFVAVHEAVLVNGIATFQGIFLSPTATEPGSYALSFDDVTPLDADVSSPFSERLRPLLWFFNLGPP